MAAAREKARQLQELQALLGLKQTLDPAAVPAVVIASGISNFEWTVTINKGSDRRDRRRHAGRHRGAPTRAWSGAS